jgi:hypothetical protein
MICGNPSVTATKGTTMRFYWSYMSLPELSDLPVAEQRAAGRRVHWQLHKRWQTWPVYLLFLPLVFAGRWIGSFVGHEEIGTAVGVLISAVISGQIVVRMARSFLKPNNSGADRK